MNLGNEISRGSYSADLVSVIIPAYNAAPYIKETLDSVFAQTYRPFEVIVVNDGSPDTPALEEALASYRDKVIYIKQENRGPSCARNTGLRAAGGTLVSLLDSDDIWRPNYLEEQTQFLREHPEFDLVYCNARFFGDSIYDGKEYMDVCPSNGEATSVAIISRRCHVFTSVTARKEVLRSFGFDESLLFCEDFDLWLRLTAAGHKIGYHRKVLVYYRKHGTSLSANLKRMAEYNVEVLNKSLPLWPEGSEEVRALLQARTRKLIEIEMSQGKQSLRERDVPSALIHFQAANGYSKSAKISAVISLLKLSPILVLALLKLRGALLPAYRDRRSEERS